MKTMIMILIAAAMVMGCATREPHMLSMDEALVCDPDCDPAGAQQLINQVLHWGGSSGWTTTQGTAGCMADPTLSQYTECWATFSDSAGNRYIVDCNNRPVSWGGGCESATACDDISCN